MLRIYIPVAAPHPFATGASIPRVKLLCKYPAESEAHARARFAEWCELNPHLGREAVAQYAPSPTWL